MRTTTKKRNRVAGLLAGTLLAVCLTGCAENQIPDMSDEQLDVMKNYVSATMMKYNMGRKSRLVDLSRYSDTGTVPDTGSDLPQGMDPVDDTPVVNEPSTDRPNTSGEGTSYRLEEVLELPEGVTITFLGQETHEFYPDDDDDGAFVVNASIGKKLLVMHFSLANGSGQDQDIDLRLPEVTYRVTINKEITHRAMTTMLLNDMLDFSDTLKAGDSTDVALVFEVDESMEGNINTISIGVKKESEVYRFDIL